MFCGSQGLCDTELRGREGGEKPATPLRHQHLWSQLQGSAPALQLSQQYQCPRGVKCDVTKLSAPE